MQLLENYAPDDLELLLIDIKQVEFSLYKDLPHLLTAPIADYNSARAWLDYMAEEMQNKYKILEQAGARNIEEFNKNNTKKLKYQVLIIDELAELLMQEKGQKLKNAIEGAETIEQSICRLAQLGRAAGVHIITATQRPSSDIITGLIKSNIPSRIALSVASASNSRIILDETGAESLIGQGDMLYKPVGEQSTRLQGAYITDEEIKQKIDIIKNKYNQKNEIELKEKRDIKKELEKALHEYYIMAEVKSIVAPTLQKMDNINIIINEIAQNEQEREQLNNIYFDILSKVEKFYKGYIVEEREDQRRAKEAQKEAEKIAKIKRRDKIGMLHIINKWLR